MDINKLNHAHELLDKSQAIQVTIDTLKNITKETTIDNNCITNEFILALFKIKLDLFEKLMSMKTEFDNEFALL